MHVVRLLLVVVIGLGTVAGCGDSAAPTAPTATPTTIPAQTFTVSGTVRDGDGNPLAEATVTVVDGAHAGRTAMTDAAGRYRLEGLAPGGFSIRVRRDGHDEVVRAITLTSDAVADVTLVRSRLQLSGQMTGSFSWTFTVTGERVVWPMTATVVQTATGISGTFRVRVSANTVDDWTGTFDGTLSAPTTPAQYDGALTISGLISTGSGRCNGERSNIRGTATTTSLTLNAPGLWQWRECLSTRQDIVIAVTR